MWDEENFYVAMRSPLREGERPIQQHRGDVLNLGTTLTVPVERHNYRLLVLERK